MILPATNKGTTRARRWVRKFDRWIDLEPHGRHAGGSVALDYAAPVPTVRNGNSRFEERKLVRRISGCTALPAADRYYGRRVSRWPLSNRGSDAKLTYRIGTSIEHGSPVLFCGHRRCFLRDASEHTIQYILSSVGNGPYKAFGGECTWHLRNLRES